LRGSYELLQELDVHSLCYDDLYSWSRRIPVADPDTLIGVLVDAGYITESARTFNLTTAGKKVLLLLTAINGGDLAAVFQKLSYLYPSLKPYELVTEGMAHQFIHSLYERPDFRRVYLCSPWIGLEKKLRGRFALAVKKAQELLGQRVEILVIMQPIKGPDKPEKQALLETQRWLLAMGAEVVLNQKLHAKLYIREPGARGGLLMAVFGSENLTKQKWIELGIKITNDSELVGKLITHYFDIYNNSQLLRRGTP
jgi:hypothetical protein